MQGQEPILTGIDPILAVQAAGLTLSALIEVQTRLRPDHLAVKDAVTGYSYRQLDQRSNRMAHYFTARGIARGDRIAILSENRIEYIEVFLAAAKIGAIVACQNWRLTLGELRHCLSLVEPRLLLASPRNQAQAESLADIAPVQMVDDVWVEALMGYSSSAVPECATPEDGIVILYTSGTTGLPKGALISHRAEIARAATQMLDMPADPEDAFIAWAPLFHMVSTDTVFKTLILGGTVIVVDGFQPDHLADLIATENLGRLTLMPGMIAPLLAAMRAKESRVKSVKWVGVMADLVPLDQIAEVTMLFQAPYLNTFGATETGFAPASAGHIGIGDIATSLDKKQSALCQIKLVDAQDQEVPEGEAGELAIRSPALFSGYWNNPKANAEDFRNGWFHMGDMFKRSPEGGLRFVDRRKYLIKSGGENIYPAEIERLILADPRVLEAAVVRQKHRHWGEVPIAFIARKDASLSEADILAHLCTGLARYKLPKAFHFIAESEFPRSTTGKIMRHVLEQRLG